MHPIHLDLETTDLDENARIVQLAYKNTETGETVNEFFKPPVPISFGAMSVHHITNEMTADKPAFEGSGQKEKLVAVLKDNILVAHNAPFDSGVLKTEGVVTSKYIDTLRVARHLIKSENHKLQYLRYSLGLNVEGMAHDALGDILVLEALFEKLMAMVMEKFSLDSTDLGMEKMMELTQTPTLLDVFTFGKHKGKDFAEVAVSDRGYLEWLYGKVLEEPEKNSEELVYTLKYYLKISD